MANIITNIPLTYREPDGNLISPIKGKPTEVSEAVASDLKNAGLAEDYSGGGGGDLSTASLTINNGLRLPTKNIVTTWIGTGEGINPAGVYTGQTQIPSGGITTFDVPLYKGLFVMDFDTSANYEVTGDAEVKNGKLYVTGNATVKYTI